MKTSLSASEPLHWILDAAQKLNEDDWSVCPYCNKSVWGVPNYPYCPHCGKRVLPIVNDL